MSPEALQAYREKVRSYFTGSSSIEEDESFAQTVDSFGTSVAKKLFSLYGLDDTKPELRSYVNKIKGEVDKLSSNFKRADDADSFANALVQIGNTLKGISSTAKVADKAQGEAEGEAGEFAPEVVPGEQQQMEEDSNAIMNQILRKKQQINRLLMKYNKEKEREMKSASTINPAADQAEQEAGLGAMEETQMDNYRYFDRSRLVPQEPEVPQELEERDNPISVESMKNILRFATPDQISRAIENMDSQELSQFIEGLQQEAIEVLSANIEGVEGANGAQVPAAETPDSAGAVAGPDQVGGGGEGNLRLADL